VTLSYSSDVVVSGSTSASAVISDERAEPQFSVDASGAGGTGATFSFSYAYDSTFNDWELTAITVTNGGSGYSEGGTVILNKSDDTTAEGNSLPWSGSITLNYTVSGGAIASVSGWDIPLDGLYGWRPAGVIESVTFVPETTYYNKIGPASGVTVTNGGHYYRDDKSGTPEVATLTIYATNKSEAAFFSGTIDDDTSSPTFGQITAIEYTGSSGGQPLLPTPTSSLTPEERQAMLDMFCPSGGPNGEPPAFNGFWEPLATHDPLTFADAAEVEDKIAELYGSGGPMAATTLYAGYCSDRTLLKNDGSKYLLGWSTPYRKGALLTPAVAAGLCLSGLPWKYQPEPEDHPAVFTSWGTAIFSNDDVPPVRSITRKASTGDAVVNRLIDTGTQDIQVVRDELNDPLDLYSKTATVFDTDACSDKDDFPDITVGNLATSGHKIIHIEIVKKDANDDPVFTWTVSITFATCDPRDDLPPNGNTDTYISDFSVLKEDHAAATVTDITDNLIENSLSFKPYTSEEDCKFQNLRTDALCENGVWALYDGDEDSLRFACCWGTAVDDDTFDTEAA
jgi:hypothetical protein